VGCGRSVIVTLRDTPSNVAVTVRVRLLVTALAVTVKLPVVDPAATTTDPGVVRYDPLSVNPTVTPPDGAAVPSVTVQVSELAPVIDPVPHAREDSRGRFEVPGRIRAVPVIGEEFPAADAPKVSLKVTAAPADAEVSVADTLAITPAGMVVVFIPAAIHIYAPARAAHLRSLSEAFKAAPAVALIQPIAEAGYCNVHCNALAPEPCGDHVISNVITPFGSGGPEEIVNAPPPCADTIIGICSTRPSTRFTSFIVPRIENEIGPRRNGAEKARAPPSGALGTAETVRFY
jgi:hypothetical protein